MEKGVFNKAVLCVKKGKLGTFLVVYNKYLTEI